MVLPYGGLPLICIFQRFCKTLGLPTAWFLDVGEPFDLTSSKQSPPSCPGGYIPKSLITMVASTVGQDPCRWEGGVAYKTSSALANSWFPGDLHQEVRTQTAATSSSLHPATDPLLSFSLTQIYTEEGNGQMLAKGTKFHFCRMNNFWRCNVQYGEDS